MRLATVRGTGEPQIIEIRDGFALPVEEGRSLREVIAAGGTAALEVGRRGARRKLPASLEAPLIPGKVVAIGLNYLDHVRETGMKPPERPLVFAKWPSSVIGTGAPIVIDETLTERVDWEVELGVVIGRRMRRVATADALDGVFGYTVGNDVSARDVQFADGQWVRAKSFDTFCPLGPAVVTPDEIGDVQDLALRTRVNGELVQDSNTSEMIFGVAELLSFCSQSFTLEPGDVVLTGTPWGCGEFMSPRRSLHPGDTVAVEVEGIGTVENLVVAQDSAELG